MNAHRTSLSLLIAGICTSATLTRADLIEFVAVLNAECAQTPSQHTGSGTFTLNTQTGVFTWNINHTVEEATFAHIHGPIANACGSFGGGDIIIDVGPISPTVGSRTLNAARQQAVLDGLTYVNVHTDLFVGGEISGVIVRAPEVSKARHISFVPGNPGINSAIRVTLTSLHHVAPPYSGGPSVPFTQFEGEVRWVGSPTQFTESTSTGILYSSSVLQCTPHYQDWGSVLRLHVTGSAIVPSSIYDVEILDGSCLGNEENCAIIHDSHTISTCRWGDVEVPYNPPSTTTQPDLADVAALINKFRSAPGSPIKARALLAGTDSFGNVNSVQDLSLIHVSVCVDAFRGLPYPHTISACP